MEPVAMNIFPYGKTETDYLSRRDSRLGRVIGAVGPIVRTMQPDLFAALCDSIIGQQISNKAAAAVSARFRGVLGRVTPRRVIDTEPSVLRSCGMSLRKAEYIRRAAEAVLDGTLDIAAMGGMSDREVVARLTALPGVGIWTAEMLMIFSLGRTDVLSYDDLIVRRSLIRLHGLSGLSRSEFSVYRERYSPFGTVASFYLWAMASDVWKDRSFDMPDERSGTGKIP